VLKAGSETEVIEMIRGRLTRLVVAVIIIALVTAITRRDSRGEESAQSGIGPATIPAECQTTINITSVQYAGKDNGKDKVLVSWNAVKPQSLCVNISEFRVDVTITRKHGNIDTGSKTVSGSASSALIEVPRALLETDPQSFDAKVVAKVDGKSQKSVRLTGNGRPSISSATQSQQSSTNSCDPVVNITTINFIPAGSGSKDTVGIFWDASVQSPCMRLSSFKARVKLTRIDGGVDTASSAVLQGNSRSAKVELPRGADVHSFEITVESSTQATTSIVIFDARKTGNF